MSGKYVFSKALKELRFHHCQTSDHSNAIRYDRSRVLRLARMRSRDSIPPSPYPSMTVAGRLTLSPHMVPTDPSYPAPTRP